MRELFERLDMTRVWGRGNASQGVYKGRQVASVKTVRAAHAKRLVHSRYTFRVLRDFHGEFGRVLYCMVMPFTGGGTHRWMSPELLDPERFGIP